MLRKYLLLMLGILWLFDKLEALLSSKLTADVSYYGFFCSAKSCYFCSGVICLGIVKDDLYISILFLFICSFSLFLLLLLLLLPWAQLKLKIHLFLSLLLILLLEKILDNIIREQPSVLKELESLILLLLFVFVLNSSYLLDIFFL